MTTAPLSPRPTRAGLVLLDPGAGRVLRIIVLQYNPDTLTRTLQPQGMGEEPGDRLEALRLKGPPHETLRVEAELDATDQLEFPKRNPVVAQYGLFPALAALEGLVYPGSGQLLGEDLLARFGTIEVAPVEVPLSLFVWSRNRILPVRVTEFSVTEEAFDTSLNPVRAKVTLGLRVLSVDDLGFDHRGGSLYLLYQRQKERFAAMTTDATPGALGVQAIPGG
ncbi:hypothetical protein ACFRIB_01505 [Streptomyces mirabilis]|uniref:hypothetical protein n=1 Tax=Streptomyces mirabilis TaxID=68239 RepID=UPI0036CD669C